MDPSKRPDVAAARAGDIGPTSGPPREVEGQRMVGARTMLPIQPGPTDMSSEPVAEASQAEPPPSWSPPAADSVFSTTIRGGIPPVGPATASEPARANHIPTLLPEHERQPPGDAHAMQAAHAAHAAAHAAQAAAHAAGLAALSIDGDLDVLPSISASAGPPSPPPIASAPVPGPAPEPAPSFQARPADDFIKSFLGGAEPIAGDGDLGGDDDFYSSPPPPPAPPWPWIGAVAAVVVALGLYMFKDSLFGADASADVAGEATTEGAPEVPEVKPEPPPPPKLVEAEPQPPPPPPVITDPAFLERLAKAKAAYSDGKLKAAAAALTELAKQAPEHPEVLLLTAQVQLEEGKMAESRTTADKCVAIDPNLADCWLTLGVLRQHGKDDAGAVAAYETYLKLAPQGRYARDANSQLARLRRSAG